MTNRNTILDVFSGNVGASYERSKFKLRTNYSYYGQTADTRSFVPTWNYPAQGFVNPVASYTETTEDFWRTQWDNTLEYKVETGGHKLTALVGTSFINDEWSLNSRTGQGFYTNSFDDVNFGLIKDESMILTNKPMVIQNTWMSYFGRVNYNYREKYLFEATLRADASSKFGETNRTGYFPSLSAGWNISEEDFIQNIEFIDLLKLRASWGINGNDQIDSYQYVESLTTEANYSLNGSLTDGLAVTTLSNPEIAWEQVIQTNIGVDADFFNNRLGVSVDYFVKETSDMLAKVGTPMYIGVAPAFTNIGSVENRGWEIALSHQNRIGDFKYNIGFNLATVKNEVTDLGGAQPISSGNAQPAWSAPITRTEVGHPMGGFYGYETDGFDESGNIQFKDLDGDGVTGDVDPDDRTFIGNPFPDFTYGIMAGAEYKNFDLSLFFFGSEGNDIYKAYLRSDAIYLNRPNYYAEGDLGRPSALSSGGHRTVSDLFVEDGSYLRLKNISLGYTLPKQIVENLQLKKVRIYISAQNLFTITDYSGADPEIGQVSSSSLALGIDRGFYPQPKTVMGGFQINF